MTIRSRIEKLLREHRTRDTRANGNDVLAALQAYDDESGTFLEDAQLHPQAVDFVQRLNASIAYAETSIPLEAPEESEKQPSLSEMENAE